MSHRIPCRIHRELPIGACLVGLSVLVAVSGGTAAWGQVPGVIRIPAADEHKPNEISVAINPTDRDNIVVVGMMRDYQQRGIANYSFSTKNGGATWQITRAPNPGSRTQGDDAVIFDEQGIAFRSFISFEKLWSDQPRAASNGIFVCRSEDGGVTWGEPIPVIDHRSTITPFEDKPWLAIDRDPRSAYHGFLYLAWTRFDRYGSSDPEDRSHIFCARSEDGGKSFFSPVRVTDSPGDCLDDDNTVEGCVPSIGTNGELYLVWAGPRGLEFDRSDDGGITFGEDKLICEMPGGWSSSVAGISRHNGMPVTGVDTSTGPHRGSLYISWIDERNADKDVFIASSRDRGEKWSSPVRVHSDPVNNGVEQFFSWMSVDPADGSINLVYFERAKESDGLTAIKLARSVDGGVKFDTLPIDVPPFVTSDEVFFGDYVGIDARNGRVAAAFPHFDGDKKLVLSVAIFDFAKAP